ncbi:SGNH/GDSL hydrolase family protein [Dactylosporangium sp. CA-139114]|uniref:SGNH/GDSL hydrolase family protein n=1 Tax=Dactylosporangium sp. CA-139114 TaxID=3239931 RepID=UPI003D967140
MAVSLVAGCAGPTVAGPVPSPSPAPIVRIMPLGDSITDGLTVPGGYRGPLWQELTELGARIDFVGSMDSGPPDLPDHDHEGHSGARIDEIDAKVEAWVRAVAPDVVLLQAGTNDVLQNLAMPEAPDRLGLLIDHVLAAAPQAIVFVASITPLVDPGREEQVEAFNARLPAVVAARGPRVRFVDMHAGLGVEDLQDGIHPNTGGYAKMAGVWVGALRPVLQGGRR